MIPVNILLAYAHFPHAFLAPTSECRGNFPDMALLMSGDPPLETILWRKKWGCILRIPI
jgi:hypothetical protein